MVAYKYKMYDKTDCNSLTSKLNFIGTWFVKNIKIKHDNDFSLGLNLITGTLCLEQH